MRPLLSQSSLINPGGRAAFTLCWLGVAVVSAFGSTDSKLSALGNVPLSFEPNIDQNESAVRFSARAPGTIFYFTNSGVSFAQFRMNILGGNFMPKIAGLDPVTGKSNYFLGNDPAKWKTGIPQFAEVKYGKVYSGIDLIFHGNQRQLEYDFVVAPGADPSHIRLGFKGASRLRIDKEGGLVVRAKNGNEIRQHPPVIYQEIDGQRRKVSGGYVINRAHEVGFKVGAYDRDRPLVIDPILSYSTYLGGATPAPNALAFNGAATVAVDSEGNIYIAGFTSTTDFPTANPQQPAYGGGNSDVIVAKFDPSGSTLVYSTYLGGINDDRAFGIAIDSQGNAYVTGSTQSPNFPITPTAFQPVSTVGIAPTNTSDAFVTKLSPTGTLVYSTFLGGNTNVENAYAIAVDSSGSAYVTGETASTDFPTKNAFQPSLATGGGLAIDAFVTKLSADGTALVYSTYLGGAGSASGFSTSGIDEGLSIAVDSAGSAYVTGYTYSSSFPTQNPLQANVAGDADIFITKFSPAGDTLVYSTYLGGSGRDNGYGIAVDSAGSAYITGSTASADFPTVSAFQPTFGGGNQDAFVGKLNPAGSALIYSTYLGGGGSEGTLSRVALNGSGEAYIVGRTDSKNFPTANAIQSVDRSAGENAFVTKLNAAGNNLVYSTYLGGTTLEYGFGIAVDSSGAAYVSGQTWSGDFPTANPLQASRRGYSDAFVAKIVEPPLVLTGVVSRKVHGSAGTFDLTLNPGTPATIEPRAGGSTSGDKTLVFSFLNTLNPAATVAITASATTSDGPQPVTVLDTSGIGTDTHEYFVDLSGVPNASHLAVTLHGVTDSVGNVGDVSAKMDVLYGDVNQSGNVDAADVGQVQRQNNQAVTIANFLKDVNISGNIDAADVGQVQRQNSKHL